MVLDSKPRPTPYARVHTLLLRRDQQPPYAMPENRTSLQRLLQRTEKAWLGRTRPGGAWRGADRQ